MPLVAVGSGQEEMDVVEDDKTPSVMRATMNTVSVSYIKLASSPTYTRMTLVLSADLVQ